MSNDYTFDWKKPFRVWVDCEDFEPKDMVLIPDEKNPTHIFARIDHKGVNEDVLFNLDGIGLTEYHTWYRLYNYVPNQPKETFDYKRPFVVRRFDSHERVTFDAISVQMLPIDTLSTDTPEHLIVTFIDDELLTRMQIFKPDGTLQDGRDWFSLENKDTTSKEPPQPEETKVSKSLKKNIAT